MSGLTDRWKDNGNGSISLLLIAAFLLLVQCCSAGSWGSGVYTRGVSIAPTGARGGTGEWSYGAAASWCAPTPPTPPSPNYGWRFESSAKPQPQHRVLVTIFLKSSSRPPPHRAIRLGPTTLILHRHRPSQCHLPRWVLKYSQTRNPLTSWTCVWAC